MLKFKSLRRSNYFQHFNTLNIYLMMLQKAKICTRWGSDNEQFKTRSFNDSTCRLMSCHPNQVRRSAKLCRLTPFLHGDLVNASDKEAHMKNEESQGPREPGNFEANATTMRDFHTQSLFCIWPVLPSDTQVGSRPSSIVDGAAK